MKMIQDPQFDEIVDFEIIRKVLRKAYDNLSPDFNMLGAFKIGSDMLDGNPSYSIAAGASVLAWMMLLASDEQDLAEELKDSIFSLGWTEEEIGSDLLSMTTAATPKSDDPDECDYHVKGRKWLINNSYHADYHMVLAKIDPEKDGPRSMSLFLVPRSSTKNWERLDTHVLRNMVLTAYDIDGIGKLVGKKGYGISIVQRMAAAARYQCSYAGLRMTQENIVATIDHLSTKTIFKEQPINFSNVFRQLYNLSLNAAFYNFLFNRAVVFSDGSFLQFHGTMLKSWLLLRTNELLAQSWLVAGSIGFLKESVIGRNAIDSFVLPVFDGHYTINTLMTAKHMPRYLKASKRLDAEERIAHLREKLWVYESGNQLNKTSRETRHPDFFDYANYWKQLDVAVPIDVDEMLGSIRALMGELNVLGLANEAEYKYKTGTLVHWLEAVLAAAEFWKVMDDDLYLNIVVQVYNQFVKTFNDIISEGTLEANFLQPIRHIPLPKVSDNEAFLRNLFDIESKVAMMRVPVVGD